MRSGDLLVRTTKFAPEKFDFLLDKFSQWAADHPKTTPLFRGDGAGSGRRGNRCNLDIRHVLLMALVHYKSNPSQDSLEAQFAVDQSSVSRYLKWAKGVLGEILPTGKNICKRIQDAKTVGEMNEIMSLGSKSETDGECELLARFARILGLSPAFGLNDSRMGLFEEFKQITRNPNAVLMLDGTHVRTVRPGDAVDRRSGYSGKKRHCPFNTNMMTGGNGLIVFASESVGGGTHDLTLLRRDAPNFETWTKMIESARLFVDKGYGGIGKDGYGIQIMIATKNKPKTGRLGGLAQEERDRNGMIAAIRVGVEHTIGRIKQHAGVSGPYSGTVKEFGQDINVATGLTNFHHIWDEIRDGRFKIS